MKDRAERWSVLGRALAVHTREGESIVMGTIGAAGYYSRLFIYDRRGLVTPEVNETPVPSGQRATPGHDLQTTHGQSRVVLDVATTACTPSDMDHMAREEGVACPERFELPTTWFEVNTQVRRS